MKTMKSIAKVALAIIATIAFVVMTAEAETPAMQVVITLSSCIVLTLCSVGLNALGAFEEKNN